MLKRSVYSVLFSLSVYEAVTIQTLVLCTSKGRGYYHIWYIYMQAALQLVQVYFYLLLLLLLIINHLYYHSVFLTPVTRSWSLTSRLQEY